MRNNLALTGRFSEVDRSLVRYAAVSVNSVLKLDEFESLSI